ncbi:LOW QUALITY PROTEIN: myosin-15 [Molossus nigricans]
MNPHEWLPVYQNEALAAYKGKRRSEGPPHIIGVAENAFQDRFHSTWLPYKMKAMPRKTVTSQNLRAERAVRAQPFAERGTSEDQIINSILEANAKTLRNDNSSHFGKFIRVHFCAGGKLSSAAMDSVNLLEKSMNFKQPGERNYHIFYQILSEKRELHDMLLVSEHPSDFHFCCYGEVALESSDDAEESLVTDQAMDILGFLPEEKCGSYKLTGAIMHFGNVKLKQKPREEQMEADGTESADKAAFQGIKSSELVSLIHPRIEVDNEYVTRGQNVEQTPAGSSCVLAPGQLKDGCDRPVLMLVVGAPSASRLGAGPAGIHSYLQSVRNLLLHQRLCILEAGSAFAQRHLDTEVGALPSLELELASSPSFRGVLMLQHMSILEQEEYRKDGTDRMSIDSVWICKPAQMSLRSTHDIPTKLSHQLPHSIICRRPSLRICCLPMASAVNANWDVGMTQIPTGLAQPKGTGRSWERREAAAGASSSGLGVGERRGAGQPRGGLAEEATAAAAAAAVLPEPSHVPPIFVPDHRPQQSSPGPKAQTYSASREFKINIFQTENLRNNFFPQAILLPSHKLLRSKSKQEHLKKLMTNLKSTAPHFVRYINPNVNKMPGVMDPYLVLQQLHCDGVLEGIRTCHEGFPNWMPSADFKQRYCILNPEAFPKSKFMNSRKADEELLGSPEIDYAQYHLGITKVFLKGGFLGQLEAMKDETKVFTLFQARVPGTLIIKFQRILEESYAIPSLGLMESNLAKSPNNETVSKRFCSCCRLLILQHSLPSGEKLTGLRTTCLINSLVIPYVNPKKKRIIAWHALLLIQWNIKTFRTRKDWPWMRLFKIKPLVQSAGMGKQVAGLEEERVPLQEALGNQREELKAEQVSLIRKNDLLLQLQAEQETLANVEEQFKSLIKSKIQLEARFKALSARVEEEEEINSELTARGRKLEDECSESKKEIDDLETILAKPQKEKRATEHKVGSLREEVESLHEDVSKLNRTAEAVWEAQQQTPDALHTEGCLTSLSISTHCVSHKASLEGALEQERKARMNCGRKKHRLEGDLKLTQERVLHLESRQPQLAEGLRTKELEMSQMTKKEHEKGLVAQLWKMVQDLQTQRQHLKEELEAERTTRAKVERERANLTQERKDLNENLGEAGEASQVQLEKTKTQEAKLQKLHDVEETTLHFEATYASLKMRHAHHLAELESQVEHPQQVKQKLEKDKSDLQLQVDDHQTHVEQMARAKANAEKLCSLYKKHLNEAHVKLDEMTPLDLTAQKTKLQSETVSVQCGIISCGHYAAHRNLLFTGKNNEAETGGAASSEQSKVESPAPSWMLSTDWPLQDSTKKGLCDHTALLG